MIKGYVGQVASPWVGKLPSINLEYPEIRTENISGNAAKFSPTRPDEFKFWFEREGLKSEIENDTRFNIAYIDGIDDGIE